jgi:chromosomal replication initiation ATPase DnaA
MASPAPDEQSSRVRCGQKRKREADDHDARTGERQFAEATGDDVGFMDPDDDDHDTDNINDDDNGSTYTPDDEDEEDQEVDVNDDDGFETFNEENANNTAYDESQEPLPACVVYDTGIETLRSRLTLIPKEVLQILPEDSVKSKSLSMHIAKAKEVTEFPKTSGIQIAILGSAGAGKSSLLNAITDIPELAKSVILT